jgi:hypothetical protein
VFLPGTVVYCKQVVYASNRTRTGSLLRQRRLNRREVTVVLEIDKSPSISLASSGREILVRGHEPKHLLLQLRIHLVRDGHDVGKQSAEFHLFHVSVQHRKNADLQ